MLGVCAQPPKCAVVYATARPTLQVSLSGTQDVGKLCLDLSVEIPPTGPASGALPSHVCNQPAWVPRSFSGRNCEGDSAVTRATSLSQCNTLAIQGQAVTRFESLEAFSVNLSGPMCNCPRSPVITETTTSFHNKSNFTSK